VKNELLAKQTTIFLDQ